MISEDHPGTGVMLEHIWGRDKKREKGWQEGVGGVQKELGERQTWQTNSRYNVQQGGKDERVI